MRRTSLLVHLPLPAQLLGAAVVACALCVTTEIRADHEDAAVIVQTYNVRYDRGQPGPNSWTHRRTAVAEAIKPVDICGLQEPLMWQVEDLASILGEFSWVGVGRRDGKAEGELSPILYRKDRFERLAWGTIWLSPTPDAIGSVGWDAALPRIATWLELRDRSTDRPLVVWNTHFDHRGETARRESATLIANAARRSAKERPVIIMGDFNAAPGSAPYQALTSGETSTDRFSDAHRLSGTEAVGPAGTFNGFEAIQERRIDHIFLSPQWDVTEFETLDPRTSDGRFASDHQPVRATLRLR